MSQHQRFAFHRTAARLGVVCLVGGLSAACSSDTMRFAESPFSNPFASSARLEPQNTASVTPAQSYPTAPVQAQTLPPLSPVAASPLPPVSSAPVAVASAPAAAAVSSARPVSLPGAKGWTAQGGSTVTVGAGDTVKALSNRYGVPETAIRAANGLSGAAQPAAGSAVIIPVYHATAAEAPAVSPAPATAPVRTASAAPTGSARMQLVKGPQPAATVVSSRSATATTVAAAPARTEPAKPAATTRPAAVAKVETKPAAPAQPVAAAKPAQAPTVAKPAQVAKAEPVKAEEPKPVAAAPAPAPAAAPAADPEKTASISKDAPMDFRWPARGRVIAGFGGKGGASNDGINIALPEGTPVKAAEAGTVAYAGNELKGYGNLVLIRHANGYVTAYAHNGEIKVKRGDTVNRGQTIATSGQTGNVATPQLHFEIRKGSTPVDPLPHLGS